MKVKTKLGILIIAALVIAGFLNYEYIITEVRSTVVNVLVPDIPGSAPDGKYPALLLHGFHPVYSERLSEFSLKEMQLSLAKDLDYDDRGLYIPDRACAELKYDENPIILRGTYFEGFEMLTIEDYAENLGSMIAKIKKCTGASKVDIVTHSMGGIVSRYYIENIDGESVRKLIMLAAPNHGGLYTVGNILDYFASYTEDELKLDFIQLSEKSELMKQLNKNETMEGVEYYTVAGNIDGEGDALVMAKSVSLEGENGHKTVECNHLFIKHPSLCPEAYEFVKSALKS